MNDSFNNDFQALIETFGELLIGKTDAEYVKKLQVWSIYSHIHKTMPNLAAHWNQKHPEAKTQIRELFEEIRDLNKQHREAGQSAE